MLRPQKWAAHASVITIVLLAAIATIGCDQASKHLARVQLAGEPQQSFLNDMVRLEYAANRGAFLGLGARKSFKHVSPGAIPFATPSSEPAANPDRRAARAFAWSTRHHRS